MAWLTLFNGVVAMVEGDTELGETAQQLEDKLDAEGFDMSIDDGGLQVYPKSRKMTTTVYSPGNSDGFADCWVGKGAFPGDNCPVWPVGVEASEPTEEERAKCLALAKLVADELGKAGGSVGPLNYGFHMVCFD